MQSLLRVANNNGLLELDIGDNGQRARHGRAMTTNSTGTQRTQRNVFNRGLGDRACLALFEAFEGNQRLQELNLGHLELGKASGVSWRSLTLCAGTLCCECSTSSKTGLPAPRTAPGGCKSSRRSRTTSGFAGHTANDGQVLALTVEHRPSGVLWELELCNCNGHRDHHRRVPQLGLALRELDQQWWGLVNRVHTSPSAPLSCRQKTAETDSKETLQGRP